MSESIDQPDRAAVPVLFIHGLWVSTLAWQPWQAMFERQGFTTSAPGYPGEALDVQSARSDAGAQAGQGIEALTEHYAAAAAALPSPPILVGHSFGGLIAQKLLAGGTGRAAVTICPAPMRGVLPLPPAQLRSAWPVLSRPTNRHRAVALSRKQWRYAFGNALSQEESDLLHEKWSIPSPGRPLFEAGTANFSPSSPAAVPRPADRAPLLIIAGKADHTVPYASVRASYRLQRKSGAATDWAVFEGRGHCLTIDAGWADVATKALQWLVQQGISARPHSASR
ncbi:alpha/beta fold hydrolase [Kineococcus gypseus]|uniref:alpha/beta hydrolase n=1 Tax=Kineococcus gypseus TaxID=1637102 RepID=UPI003D7D60D1